MLDKKSITSKQFEGEKNHIMILSLDKFPKWDATRVASSPHTVDEDRDPATT